MKEEKKIQIEFKENVITPFFTVNKLILCERNGNNEKKKKLTSKMNKDFL